jgi:hypothetical protein
MPHICIMILFLLRKNPQFFLTLFNIDLKEIYWEIFLYQIQKEFSKIPIRVFIIK